jgi:predicted RNase H-like HicB family nuclease
MERSSDAPGYPTGAEARSMLLKVIFEPSDEGGYTAFVPALPGCVSEGETLEETGQNIRDAIALYLEPTEEPVLPEGGFVEEIAV